MLCASCGAVAERKRRIEIFIPALFDAKGRTFKRADRKLLIQAKQSFISIVSMVMYLVHHIKAFCLCCVKGITIIKNN